VDLTRLIDQGPLVERWSVYHGYRTFYYVGLILFGGAGLVVGTLILFGIGQPSPIYVGVMFLGIGLLFIVLGLSSIVFPAKTVDRLADGSFRFSARRLTLDVAPGELVFVLQFPMDGNRLLPMRVEARRGKVWLTPQLNEINTLFNELAAQNPSAIIDSPLPQWLSRSRRV
jgi:hypothetical protein